MCIRAAGWGGEGAVARRANGAFTEPFTQLLAAAAAASCWNDMDPEAAALAAPIHLTAEVLPCGPRLCQPSAGAPIPVGLSLLPLTPLTEQHVLHRDPLRCSQCEGFIGPHCDISHLRGSWTCGICGTDNRSLTLAMDPAELALQPELREPAVEYVVRPPPARSAARSGGSGGSKPPGLVLFLVDDTAGAGLLDDLLAAARDAVPLMPPDALIGLLTFGRTVSVYLLQQGEDTASAGVVEALVVSAADAPAPWEIDALRAKAGAALAPRRACDGQLLLALEALQPAPALPGGHRGLTASSSTAEHQSRGLLAAIDVAFDLIALHAPAAATKCGELIIALAGPPNFGPVRVRVMGER